MMMTFLALEVQIPIVNCPNGEIGRIVQVLVTVDQEPGTGGTSILNPAWIVLKTSLIINLVEVMLPIVLLLVNPWALLTSNNLK